jgi:hypothetical protein
MGHENKTYVIINASDVSSVNFNQVLETSESTLRYNNDDTLTFFKYIGPEPSSLLSITKVVVNGRTHHTHSQILEVLSTTGTTGWIVLDEI